MDIYMYDFIKESCYNETYPYLTSKAPLLLTSSYEIVFVFCRRRDLLQQREIDQDVKKKKRGAEGEVVQGCGCLTRISAGIRRVELWDDI